MEFHELFIAKYLSTRHFRKGSFSKNELDFDDRKEHVECLHCSYKSRIHDVGANFNCQIRQIEVERNEKEAAVKELQILKETNKMLQKEILMLNGKLKKETYAKEEALTRYCK